MSSPTTSRTNLVARILAWLVILLMGAHLLLIDRSLYGFDATSLETIGIGLVVAGGVLNMLAFRRYRSAEERKHGGGGIGQPIHFLERLVHAMLLVSFFYLQSQMLGLPGVV